MFNWRLWLQILLFLLIVAWGKWRPLKVDLSSICWLQREFVLSCRVMCWRSSQVNSVQPWQRARRVSFALCYMVLMLLNRAVSVWPAGRMAAAQRARSRLRQRLQQRLTGPDLPHGDEEHQRSPTPGGVRAARGRCTALYGTGCSSSSRWWADGTLASHQRR